MKYYDEFGVAYDPNPRRLEAMLANHNRVCLGCKQFEDGREVYTVALGIDFGIMGSPLIFETAWKRHDEFQDVLGRYPTRASAELGHEHWLDCFEAGYPASADTSPPGGMI